MSSIVINSLSKVFGGEVVAVQEMNLEVAEGEMVALLGPSGCGKTTTMRCIAGLEEPTVGDIYLGHSLVSAPEKKVFLSPEARNIGMVFQSYAVWPHMTVFENVAFPLKVKRRPKREVKERVEWALGLTRMDDYAHRYPTELSGGQQQRVALSRAVVGSPRVLLFDEPLSNLDARLRDEMRLEISRLQKDLKITTVYVTHDQAEAMVMADRVAVMNAGRLIQIGTPENIYQSPANEFVANFVGDANLLQGEMIDSSDEGPARVKISGDLQIEAESMGSQSPGSRVSCLIRPENIILGEQSEGEHDYPATVTRQIYFGGAVEYELEFGAQSLRARCHPRIQVPQGQGVRIRIEPRDCIILRDSPIEEAGRDGAA